LIKMDPKELRGLVEAYSEVYAPQEVDEAVKGESSERRSDLAAERKAGLRPKSAKEGEAYASHKLSQMAYVKRQRMGEEVEQIDEISQKTATSAYAQRRTGEFEGDDASDRVAKTNKLKGRIEKKFGAKAGEHAEKAADVKTFGRKDASGRRQQRPEPRIQTSDHENQREFKRELRIKRDRRLRAARGEDTNEQVDIFDVVLEFLQVEGYVETLEEAEWLMANVIDEEAIDIILGEEQLDELSNRTVSNALNARIAATGAASDREMKNRTLQNMRDSVRASEKESSMRSAVAKRRERMNKEEFELDEAITSEKGKAKAAEMIAARSTPSGRAKAGQGANVDLIKHIGRANVDKYMGTPPNRKIAKNPVRSNFSGLPAPGSGNKAARRAGTYQEQFELWVNSLVEEGYNLSGYTWDEMYEFYLDEAQVARNNPEKYEREQSKKSAPVRGEKTPMPPRGDKRREDFEKWYAANVR
jgi:hypothetical protein